MALDRAVVPRICTESGCCLAALRAGCRATLSSTVLAETFEPEIRLACLRGAGIRLRAAAGSGNDIGAFLDFWSGNLEWVSGEVR